MVAVLRLGAAGAEITLLQQQLAAAGFRPGSVDGRFGPATEAALLAFQRAHGLLPDGIAGPISWHALTGRGAPAGQDRSADITVELVAAMFPMTAIGPIRRFLPAVIAGLRAAALVDKPMLLTALATIRAESEGFAPVVEGISRFNTSPEGHPFDLYDHRADLGNQGAPDGARFCGRGFVQLTGRDNYRHYGELLDLPLAGQPERACEPSIAARLLAAFLAERQRPIKLALVEGDLARVRRLVNGGRNGLDRFQAAYRTGDRLLADPVWAAA